MRKWSKADLYLPRSVYRVPLQGVTVKVRAVISAPLAYTVEPVTGGCDVIRPRFGARFLAPGDRP